MVSLNCSLEIFSDLELEEVAAAVSDNVLGGVRFIGRDEHIFDEVPAVYTERDIFGLRITLQGYGGADGYLLEMRDRQPIDPRATADEIRDSVVNISSCISQSLQHLAGINASFKGFMRLTCNLEIISDKSLEEVAALISERIFGGVRFVGRDEHIYDQVPAIYAERDILGLRVILQGYGGVEPYILEMRPREPLDPSLSPDFIRKSVVDISGYVSRLLQGIEGVSVSFK
jgi:hypothetical protein